MMRTKLVRGIAHTGVAVSVIGVLLAFTPSAQAHGGICDAAALDDALAMANPGDVVRIGNCSITGANFTVPAGVRLQGSFFSRLNIPVGELGLIIETEAGLTTQVRGWGGFFPLRIKSDGFLAAQVVGDGTAKIDRTRFRIRKGVGLAAELAADVRVHRSQFIGSVRPRNAATVPEHADVDQFSTHGLIMNQVGNVVVDRVAIRGFARFGMLLIESAATVKHSVVYRNVGVGAMAHGGTTDFLLTSVWDTYRGARPEDEQAAGFVFAAGAAVTSRYTSSTDNEGWGVLQAAAGIVEHTGFVAAANTTGGILAQEGEYLQVDDGLFVNNGLGGLMAVDTDMVVVSDTLVSGTTTETVPGFATTGDGIHLASTSGSLSNVTFANNEQAGFVGSLGDTQLPSDITFEGVTASGVGESYGVLLQQFGTPLEPVVGGVERFGPLLGNDQDWFIGGIGLETVGVQQPCFLPEPIQILEEGLASLFFFTA